MNIFGNSLDYAHRSEKKVADVLRRLDDRRISHIFSFGVINRNLSNTDHEADLVLIGPAGVYVVEIKSGPIKIEDGQYFRGNTKLKSPIIQAKQAWYDLQKHFEDNKIPLCSLRLGGYCALYVDVNWAGGDKDADNLIMDSGFFNDPVGLLEKIVANRTEVSRRNGWRTEPYSKDEICQIKNAIVSNSYQAPIIRLSIDESAATYVSLGVEQSVLYSGLSHNKRVRIVGPPGSGKTLLAFQILRDNFKSGTKTLYVCKNKALANMLSAKFFEDYGSQDLVTIKTIDSLVYILSVRLGLENNISNYVNYIEKAKCLNAELNKVKPTELCFDSLIIDEAQDVLNIEYCDLLDKLLTNGIEEGSWRLFYDPEQDVFSSYEKETFDLYFNDKNSFEYILQKNYRNTVEIQKAAKAFSKHSYEITNNINPIGEPPEILIYKQDDLDDEASVVSKAINDILKSGVKPNEITILSFVSKDRSVAGKGPLKLVNGIRTVHINNRDWGKELPDVIYYASVYEYKGLDNEVIVYTDIDQLDIDEKSRIAHFVGATRAKVYYIMIVSSEIAKILISEIGKSPLGEFGERISLSKKFIEKGHENLIKAITPERKSSSNVDPISDDKMHELIVPILTERPMSRSEISSRTGIDKKSLMAHMSKNRDKIYSQGGDLLWFIKK